jgi:maleamate amidohydrolase
LPSAEAISIPGQLPFFKKEHPSRGVARLAEALDTNYAKAGFGASQAFGKSPALLLVDFAQAYFEPSSPLFAGVEDARRAACSLLAAARDASIPVVFTRVVYQAGGVDGGVFFRKVPALQCFLAGSALGDFAQGLAPRAGELVIDKQYPSAFFGTSLASTLHTAGVDTIILCGLSTSGCVRATCVDSMSHGFVTIVARDACGDRHPGPHEANLFDMNAKYADVLGQAALFAYLAGVASASA